jgi:WD40 repeat protein
MHVAGRSVFEGFARAIGDAQLHAGLARPMALRPARRIGAWPCWLAHLLLTVTFATASSPAACQVDPTPGNAFLQVELGDHGGAVRRIAVDPARNLVVTGSDDKTARSWSLDTGLPGRVFRPPVGPIEQGRVYGVALHPTQPWVAIAGTSGADVRSSTGHAIYIHDSQTGQMLRRFDAKAGDIKRLVWSADGSLLVAGYAGSDGMRVFDASGTEVFSDSFDAGVYALAVTPGRIAAAALDGALRVYAVTHGSTRTTINRVAQVALSRNPASIAFSPDAALIAVGYFVAGRLPDVVNVSTGAVAPVVSPLQLGRGTLMSVTWSQDGRVVAGGSHGFERRSVPLVTFDLDRKQTGVLETGARSTITDVTTLADGRLALAVANGAWGVVSLTTDSTIRLSLLPDLTGPTEPRLSRDGRQISWTLSAGSQRVLFDLDKRALLVNTGAELVGPRLRRGLLGGPSNWQDDFKPVIGGRPISLQPDELSRAVTLFADSEDAVLGTSRALYRIGSNGQILWRISTHTEVRGVNVTANGKVIVTTMLDGVVRLWRSADGRELLSIMVLPDGRWVVWTPDGYFDASVGADTLVGWVVNRPAGDGTDYYPVARLRSRFHQPRYIDLLLETLDASLAAERHKAEMDREGSRVVDAQPVATPAVTSALPVLRVEQFPPALSTPLSTMILRLAQGDRDSTVEIPVAVLAHTPTSSLSFEGRVNGRPAPLTIARLPAEANGSAQGLLRIAVHAEGKTVQVLARDGNGYSEPLSFVVERLMAPQVVAAVQPAAVLPPAHALPPPLAVADAPAKPDQAPPAPGLPSEPPASASAGAPPRPPPPTPAASEAVSTRPPQTPPAPPTQVAVPASSPSQRTDAPVAVSTPATSRLPRLFVLVVGVSDYQRTEYHLKFAAKDARDFAATAEAQRGKFYSEVTVRRLLNSDARRSSVLAELRWLGQAAGKDDVTMLFVSGHGVNNSAGQYYFMSHDAKHEDLAKTAVGEDDIRNALRSVAGRVVFFFDTCYAGNAVGGLSDRNREASRFVNDLASTENGVVVFASSSARQVSLEFDGWNNGAFTRALVQGFSGKADLLGRGVITYKGLDYYVSEEVKRLTDRRQTPVSLLPWGVPDFGLASL